MTQGVGAFVVLRIAYQVIRPLVEAAHGIALRRQGVGQPVQRFKLGVVARLELEVLAGVVVGGLQRLGEDLQRQRSAAVGQPGELHQLLGMLLQADGDR